MSVRPITDTLRHIGGGVFIDTASDTIAARFVRALQPSEQVAA